MGLSKIAMTHSYLYPPSYLRWLKDQFTNPPAESSVDCENCSMANPSGLTRDPGPFKANLKCCTYFPFLPNFSLGQLSEEQYHRAKPKGLFLPVGLYESVTARRYRESVGAQGFGQDENLLCPFFDQKKNQCGIWNYRPGVCTTYFCKSDRGQEGLNFWAGVEKKLNDFEWKLATETLRVMNFDQNTLAYCQSAVANETDDEERDFFIQAAWGQWVGQEFQFYQEAFRQACQLVFDNSQI